MSYLRFLFVVVFVLLVLPSVVIAQEQSWCGIQRLYFQHNVSTSPAGYEELINYPSGNTEVDENVSVINTGGPVLIDNYIIPENSLEETTMLLMGLRKYIFYSYVSSSVGTTRLNFTAFRRFSNGTEQNFYTALSDDINALSITEYDMNYVSQVSLNLNPTDRLGIRVSANTTHSSPIYIHWVYQGSTHASNFESGYFVCHVPPPIQINVAEQEPQNIPISPAIPCVAVGVVALLIAWNKRD